MHQVKIALALPDAPSGSKRRYERVLRPFAPIDAAASSFRLTKFKLDLVLVSCATIVDVLFDLHSSHIDVSPGQEERK